MHRISIGKSLLLLFIATAAVNSSFAQTGILSASRISDWPRAGLPGDVPPDASWTQCGSTIAAYGSSGSPASASTISTAIAGCAANHFVLLGNGDFYLNSCISFDTGSSPASNLVLRGGGANNTRLHFSSGATDCGGTFGGSMIALGNGNGMFPETSNSAGCGGCNTANWTSCYSQGT